MFPSPAIPLTAACKLAAFGTDGRVAMTGQNGCFVLWLALPRVCVKGMVGREGGWGDAGEIKKGLWVLGSRWIQDKLLHLAYRNVWHLRRPILTVDASHERAPHRRTPP
jgi:hypothetical protein